VSFFSWDDTITFPSKYIPARPRRVYRRLTVRGDVAEYEFLEEIPVIGKPFLATDAGLLALTNVPENRFGLAVARHFRNEQEKFLSFM
jgi:hypothetical protein